MVDRIKAHPFQEVDLDEVPPVLLYYRGVLLGKLLEDGHRGGLWLLLAQVLRGSQYASERLVGSCQPECGWETGPGLLLPLLLFLHLELRKGERRELIPNLAIFLLKH